MLDRPEITNPTAGVQKRLSSQPPASRPKIFESPTSGVSDRIAPEDRASSLMIASRGWVPKRSAKTKSE